MTPFRRRRRHPRAALPRQPTQSGQRWAVTNVSAGLSRPASATITPESLNLHHRDDHPPQIAGQPPGTCVPLERLAALIVTGNQLSLSVVDFFNRVEVLTLRFTTPVDLDSFLQTLLDSYRTATGDRFPDAWLRR